jgi:hypothetical protein
MAKSGTSAIAAALRRAGVAPVYQVHDLDPDHLLKEERQYEWSGRPWRIWDAHALRRSMPSPSRPWRVVSLVRDPIAQSVSAFFQPGQRKGYLTAGATVEQLRAEFGDRLERLQLNWFETHIEPAFGIDVFAEHFDLDRGYQMIETPSVHLMLMRFEGLGSAPAALAELLRRDEPVFLPRANVSADKPYGGLYDSFVAALRPSGETIERVYASRLVRHFYTDEEISRFRTFWSARGDEASPALPDE